MDKNDQTYGHLMLEEIYEQPKVAAKLIEKYINITNDKVELKAFKNVRTVQNINRITFLGCGSSLYAAMLGNYIFEEITGLPCEAEAADEFISRKIVVEYRTAVVALSQSGETEDLIRAVKKAKKKGALIIAVTNNRNSGLAKNADVVLETLAGEENAVAATKTFSSQLIVLALLALYVAGNHKLSLLTEKFVIQELKMLPDKISKTLKLEREILKLSEKYSETKNLVILGKKYNYPLSQEAAQKIKETTYIQAEGYASDEFMHGPNAIVDKDFPLIFMIPKDSVYEDNLAVLKKLKKQTTNILAITTKGNKKIKNLVKQVLFIPQAMEALTPVLEVITMQFLALYIARAKGIDPDRPRNISKVVDKK